MTSSNSCYFCLFWVCLDIHCVDVGKRIENPYDFETRIEIVVHVLFHIKGVFTKYLESMLLFSALNS